MISMGIELEESRCVSLSTTVRLTLTKARRKLQLEISSLSDHATSLQKAQVLEKLNTFYRKLLNWFEVQVIYIPAVATLRLALPSPSEPLDIRDINISATDLWLPSGIGSRVPWDKSLGDYEWLLRVAQAKDALEDLRQNLYLRDFLWKKKKEVSRGIRENTRSQALIERASAKVTASAAKYRIARAALSQLAPFLSKDFSWASEMRELSESDVEGLPAEGWGEGRKRLSWIWVAVGMGPSGDGSQLQPLADGIM